jgi:hypothetical protein
MTEPTSASPSPDAATPHALAGTRRRDGTDLSSAVYGSLLVTTLVAAQARSDASTEFIVATLLIAVGVFWLTEVWSEVVNHRAHGPISRAGLLEIAREESPMLLAAIPPAIALATASVGLTTAEQAIDIALVVGVIQLFIWGLVVGLAVNRGWGVALLIASVDCALGLLIVVLKVLVLH